MIDITQHNPVNLQDELKNKICNLHRSFFNLELGEAAQYLEARDLVYVFSEKEGGEVVGSVAIKWIQHEKSIIIYIGNVVFSEKYQRQNFLSHVIFQSYLKTLLKFPGKKVYFSVFMTTPKAYNLGKRFPHHFPCPTKKTPQDILSIMNTVANEIAGAQNYKTTNDVIIINNFKKKNFMHNISKEVVRSYDGFFEEINPDFAKGEQLLSVFPVTYKEIFLMSWNSLYYFIKKTKRSLKIK